MTVPKATVARSLEPMTVHPKLADRTCYHKYEIEPGLFTPGLQLELDPKLCLDELGVLP